MSGGQSLAPGTVFAGEYRVDRLIGQGGMAQVFACEQLTTGKMRALKLMHPTLVSDDEHKRRFLREARAGARIESDHVVEVFGAGVDQETGVPFIVMELLTGETLYDRVKAKGPLSLAELAFVFKELAHATAAAHAAGVVHRDLKPENVFLAQTKGATGHATVKVLDFGIAKLVAEAGTKGTTGAMGSPLWMAPEQTEPGTITPAADVWALGLVAFFSLTGKYFWLSARDKDATVTQLLREILFEPLPLAHVRASALGVANHLPKGFDEWFQHCVSREREARFVDGKACGAAFAAFAPDPSGSEFASTMLGDPLSVQRIRSLPPSAAIRITPPRSADAIDSFVPYTPAPSDRPLSQVSRELGDTAPDTSPPMTPAPQTPIAGGVGAAQSQPPSARSQPPNHPSSTAPNQIPQGTPPPLSSSRKITPERPGSIGPWIFGSAALLAIAIVGSIVMLRPSKIETGSLASGTSQVVVTRSPAPDPTLSVTSLANNVAALPNAESSAGALMPASSAASPNASPSGSAVSSAAGNVSAPSKVAANGGSRKSAGSSRADLHNNDDVANPDPPKKVLVPVNATSNGTGKKWQWKVSGHVIYVQSRQITVNGNVPVDVVRGAMDWDGWEYLRCYEREFNTASSLPEGTITLKFKIFNQLPQNGSIDRSDFSIPKFNDCVMRTALGQTANAAGSAGFADVSYTLAFTVGGAAPTP